MRSPGRRRAALLTGAATVAVIALSGCSAGQVAETAILQSPVSGLNTQSPDGGLLIRNLQVVYNNPLGYAANSAAQLEVSLFNQTEKPVTVLISSRPQQTAGGEDVVTAQQVGLSGGTPPPASPSAAPEPSGSRPPADAVPGNSEQVEQPSVEPSLSVGGSAPAAPATALLPARITIAPLGSAVFLPGGQQTLVAAGLSDRLAPGGSLSLVFEISGSTQPIEALAPMGVPLSPASRAPGLEGENRGE